MASDSMNDKKIVKSMKMDKNEEIVNVIESVVTGELTIPTVIVYFFEGLTEEEEEVSY